MKKSIFFILFLFSLNFISAVQIGNQGEQGVNFKYSTPTNYSLVNVNNSIFWQSHTGTDGSWLTGISTFNTTYNSKADYQFNSNNFNGSGNYITSGDGTFRDLNINNKINFSNLNNENLVAKMFTKVNPYPYNVTSSTNVNGNNEEWQAFDYSYSSGWLASTITGWVKYNFNTPTFVSSYNVVGARAGNLPYSPKNWSLEGSNTGLFTGEQIILDTQNNVASWSDGEKRNYIISSPNEYRYYRFNITQSQGAPYTGVVELEYLSNYSNILSGNSTMVKLGNYNARTEIRGNTTFVGNIMGNVNFIGNGSGRITIQQDSRGLKGSWIDFDTTNIAGIGSGGFGASPWIATCASGGQWFSTSNTGDVAYRNLIGRILIGTDVVKPGLIISNNSVNYNLVTIDGFLNVTGNMTSSVYKGMIDWINVPISATLTGTTACTNLNNLVGGYSYTCQTCVDALAGTNIACGTIASVIENCACKVN